jgi:hypothetical protein
MNRSKRLVSITPLQKILVLFVLVILLVVGGYIGYKNREIISSRVTTIFLKMTGWKRYVNDKYKFSIVYPSDVKHITELGLPAGTRNMSKNWHLLLTNQIDYPKLENDLYGKGLYFIQIEISDSTNYVFPFKDKILVTKDNFNSLFGEETSEHGYIEGRPTVKNKSTTYPKHGHIYYVIYDNNRIIEINADSDNLDKIPFTTLDKIISSFQLF